MPLTVAYAISKLDRDQQDHYFELSKTMPLNKFLDAVHVRLIEIKQETKLDITESEKRKPLSEDQVKTIAHKMTQKHPTMTFQELGDKLGWTPAQVAYCSR
jgi:hypothetical protein